MSVAPLEMENAYIGVRPSKALVDYIRGIESENGMPKNVQSFRSTEEFKDVEPNSDHGMLFDATDQKFIDSLALDELKDDYRMYEAHADKDCNLLCLKDLHWIKKHIEVGGDQDVHYNELFEGSILVLPQNKVVSRNWELEARCMVLLAQEANRRYDAMVKNVDCSRGRALEDSIAQMHKNIEAELIGVFQIIVSILASFAFGFLCVDFMIGQETQEHRIMRGLMFAFLVGLAEIYFLLKKLTDRSNENKQDS